MPKILGSVFRNDFETIDFEEFKLMMHQGYVWKMRDNYKLRCKGCKLWLKECNGGCYANNSSAVFNENIRLDVKCNTSD
jgi:radical SAM protein with 4Fe4S-binding SPASM domain